MMKINRILMAMTAMFAITACKTSQNIAVKNEVKVPLTFEQKASDSATVAKLNWRKYFTDEVLVNLIDTALMHNYDLQIAMQRIEMARAGMRYAKANLLPTVAARLSAGQTDYAKYTQEYAGNTTTFYDGNNIVPNPLNDFNIGLMASWEIDVWGKLRNQKKSAILNYLAGIEGKNLVVSNLVAEIAVTYYELLALDNELQIVKQTIQKQTEAFETVKLQKEVGKTNELAVQQFHAQLLNSLALERETMQKITVNENKIHLLTGKFPTDIIRNTEALFNAIPNDVQCGVPSQLLAFRPDIRQAERRLQATRCDIKAAKASFFPNINLSALVGLQSFRADYLFLFPASVGSSVLSGLMSPVFNRNAIRQQYNLSKANDIAALNEYRKTTLNAFLEVSSELSNLENLKEIKRIKTEENEVLENSVITSGELYRSGKAGYLEVLIAQQNSLQTKLQLIEVQKKQQLSVVNIYRMLGGGW
jgi:NodT family efflux transporter outer membrane factor (OMF) lipoprotein